MTADFERDTIERALRILRDAHLLSAEASIDDCLRALALLPPLPEHRQKSGYGAVDPVNRTR